MRANSGGYAHRKLQLSPIAHVATQKPVSEALSKQFTHAIGANSLALTITTAGRHERKAEQEGNSNNLGTNMAALKQGNVAYKCRLCSLI